MCYSCPSYEPSWFYDWNTPLAITYLSIPPNVTVNEVISFYSPMLYMRYSAISILRPIFLVCRILFIVPASRFPSWAYSVGRDIHYSSFIVHRSLFIVHWRHYGC